MFQWPPFSAFRFAQMHVQCLQMTPGARALDPHGSWGASLPFTRPRKYGL